MTINRFTNSILLSAIGDALGWMTEFSKSAEDVQKKYGEYPVSKFYAWSKFCGSRFNGYLDEIAAGSYSDDTQLMLATARSILPTRLVDHDYFAKRELPIWLDYKRGGGITVSEAAKKIQRKSAAWNNNFFSFKRKEISTDYRDCGANGAAMRILPLALLNFDDLEKLYTDIFCNSIVTHGHPRAIIGAMLYGYIIHLMLTQNLSGIELIIHIGKNFGAVTLDEYNKLCNLPELAIWFKMWESIGRDFSKEFAVVLEEVISLLRDCYLALKNDSNLFVLFESLGVFNPDTKGSGIVTVIAALMVNCKYKDYKAGLIFAANLLGADTDSIAAFYGAMVGCSVDEKLDTEVFGVVQDKNYLLNVAKYLFEIRENSVSSVIIKATEVNNILHSTNNDPREVFMLPFGAGEIISSLKLSTISKSLFVVYEIIEFKIGQSLIKISRVTL